MTPKEKAEELLDNYRTIIRKADIYGNLDSKDEIYLAKQCALITVDEILSANYIWYKGTIPYNYWIKVKQQIEVL